MATTDLAQRVALVTGAGTGIGRAIALALGNAGATVGLHYHSSQEGAEETAALLRDQGGRAFLLPADLSIEAQANATVDRLIEATGCLDILVNNAGSPLEYRRQTPLGDAATCKILPSRRSAKPALVLLGE